MLQDGEILKGRYKIANLIGKGGMSRVYLATDMKLSNKMWAIKEVSRHATDQAGRPIEQSLATEAELLSKLDHPTIVDIVDIISTDKFIYVVMDHVEGKSLDKVVREEGPQSEEDVQNWMIQICDALDYLHSQDPPIIYRDMKPANIMLRPDGYVKLIDLGVAREYKDEAKKDTIAFGTEGYAPPEQYGRAQTDARADIYALGATMWHLLTGEAPSEYPLPDVRSKVSNVGEGFASVIIPKCCELDREMRYPNCDALVADLEVYEELTQEYFNKQHDKVRRCFGSALAGVTSIVIGVVLMIAGNVVVTQNYEAQMRLGSSEIESDAQGALEAFNEAISYKPGELDAYKQIINLYTTKIGRGSTDNPIMDKDGFQEILETIEKHDSDLRASHQLGLVNYEFAKAIWDYYDDGSGQISLDSPTSPSKAKEFFEIAASNLDPVTNSKQISFCNMYIKIADFTTAINKFEKDNDGTSSSSGNELVNEYFNDLSTLVYEVSNSSDLNTSKKAQLISFNIVQAALKKNAESFYKYGISKDKVTDLSKRVREGLTALDFGPNLGDLQNAKSRVLTSLDSADKEIEKKYSNANVGNK